MRRKGGCERLALISFSSHLLFSFSCSQTKPIFYISIKKTHSRFFREKFNIRFFAFSLTIT